MQSRRRDAMSVGEKIKLSEKRAGLTKVKVKRRFVRAMVRKLGGFRR
ncbi:MAG: hypothetical protein HON47_05080 [Candidatus Diapherotrites archaeon]|jgi:hypothetical protein|uniref:Uncharacterized protein n=1 Tax=Candidatus Iainarchaeum sp. TaxID=3101447 RepID=A0A8T5GGA4_9ARCH|nr:hypothetical protein [Candidatus Diapherotrites archaeon]